MPIKLKIESHLKLQVDVIFLTPETMKLLGSTKNKITKDQDSQNVHHLETI